MAAVTSCENTLYTNVFKHFFIKSKYSIGQKMSKIISAYVMILYQNDMEIRLGSHCKMLLCRECT